MMFFDSAGTGVGAGMGFDAGPVLPEGFFPLFYKVTYTLIPSKRKARPLVPAIL